MNKRNAKMKICALMMALCMLILLCMSGCAPENESPSETKNATQTTEAQKESTPWDSALYTEDTAFGTGEKTVVAKCVVGENSVSFTIKTDAETLADALLEHNLIEGDMGAYGIYIKKVNGILADYDINASYWSLQKDGEAMSVGADSAKIADGETYELVYTK